jgi:hypothetical protein
MKVAKRRLHDDHDAFDRGYWRSRSPDERAEMVWVLFVQQCAMNGD